MKFFIILLFPIVATGQISHVSNSKFVQVGNINKSRGDVPEVALEKSINNGSDTMYVIRFMDATFKSPVFSTAQPSLQFIYFKGENNALGTLYEILKNVFTDKNYKEKNYETSALLGNQVVTIRRDFYSDNTKVEVIVGEAMFVIKSVKDLDKLFGL